LPQRLARLGRGKVSWYGNQGEIGARQLLDGGGDAARAPAGIAIALRFRLVQRLAGDVKREPGSLFRDGPMI